MTTIALADNNIPFKVICAFEVTANKLEVLFVVHTNLKLRSYYLRTQVKLELSAHHTCVQTSIYN